MEALKRNETTAEEASKVEDAVAHPLCPGKQHSPEYFEILKIRRKLPISAKRQEFLDAYHSSKVLVLSSDTGSGKTTQIPQFVLFDEFASGLEVVCTQPRVLATKSVASRVAKEMDVKLGDEVGYHVRFEQVRNAGTRLTYMTEGILLRQIMGDQLLSRCACVIIDEAHERTINTDLLMALLKRALTLRHNLKVVIMSATLDAGSFQVYFGNAPSLHIPGRAFPVQTLHVQQSTVNVLVSAANVAVHLHNTRPAGDILVFLSGEDEIERLCSFLRKETTNLDIMPLYSRMSRAEQDKINEPRLQRKCIVTTNIAETSLTIDGVVYVVDSGLAKHMLYNPRAQLSSLQVGLISKASARQRMGRAGRTQPGVCIRLYTKSTLENDMLPSNQPGIMYDRLDSLILTLKAAGVSDVRNFGFIDAPPPESLLRAMEELTDWGYLNEAGVLTSSGRLAVTCPLDPIWWRVIEAGGRFGCSEEIVDIAATLSVQQSIFHSPRPHQQAARFVRTCFTSIVSDHLAYLSAFNAFRSAQSLADKEGLDLDEWCHEHFLNRRAMEDALNIRESVRQFLRQTSVPPKTCSAGDNEMVRKALAVGFFSHAAIHQGGDLYKTVHGNVTALLSPDSGLIDKGHEWIVFNEVRQTAKPYLVVATAVKPEWIQELPYFADQRLSRRFNGEFRQNDVKKSLDRVRAMCQ